MAISITSTEIVTRKSVAHRPLIYGLLEKDDRQCVIVTIEVQHNEDGYCSRIAQHEYAIVDQMMFEIFGNSIVCIHNIDLYSIIISKLADLL